MYYMSYNTYRSEYAIQYSISRKLLEIYKHNTIKQILQIPKYMSLQSIDSNILVIYMQSKYKIYIYMYM